MVAVVVFEFGGMRCQPLRRALAACATGVENLNKEILNGMVF
ncbi:acetyltransferase [Vibrio cholerae]|nr:acetyltransferase [Vibrio cholerae]ELR6565938.1 acetyltransferase [Vibrio cholerae]